MNNEKKDKLKKVQAGNINNILSQIAEKYKKIILIYIQDITGKKLTEISDKEVQDYIINMVYISTHCKESYNMLTEFVSLTQEEVKERLAQNAYIREILNKKAGIKKDYDFKGERGDHNLCDSLDFSLKEVKCLTNMDITKEDFKIVSDKYSKLILNVIKRNPNLNVYLVYNSKEYDERAYIDNYNNFLIGETELNIENKIIFKEMINLLATYSLEELLNNEENTKQEIISGIYDYIKQPNPRFHKSEKEKLNNVIHIWQRSDIANYINLPLLLNRYKFIKENGKVKEIDKIVNIIEEITNAISFEIPKEDESIIKYSKDMEKWYNYFERVNREDILNSVYLPGGNINIDKRQDVPDSLLVHFYNPDKSCKDIFKLVAINRMRVKNGEQPIILENLYEIYENDSIKGKIIEDSKRFKEYIEGMQIEDYTDELKPGKAFCFNESDIKFPKKQILENSSTQLACYLICRDSLLGLLEDDERMTSGSGNIAFAVGFSKNNVATNNILLSSDKNANSNMGINNIPCEDRFVDLSKTYKEISEKKGQRTEVLLNREGISASYLLILKNDLIDEIDKELINNEVKNAKKLEIDILCLDIAEINKNDIKKQIDDRICY